MRDDRPAADLAAPAVWFAYSPDRKGEHPQQHLREFSGTLRADAYAGFNQLYETTTVLSIAFDAQSRLYVLESMTNPGFLGPGQVGSGTIVRIDHYGKDLGILFGVILIQPIFSYELSSGPRT